MFEGAFKFFHDGGPVMYPLLLASLVALTIVIERSLFHVRRWLGKDREGLLDVLELVRHGQWEEARTRAEGSGDFLLNAVGTSLGEQGFQARGVFEARWLSPSLPWRWCCSLGPASCFGAS